MKNSQFNKRWHSPTNVFMHLDELAVSIGQDKLEKNPRYQKAREARIAAVIAFVLSNFRNLPTYIRLPLDEPPDILLMQPNSGTMDITQVELTTYRSSPELLLDQLIRTKLQQNFPATYILLVHLLTEDGVDYQAINKYLREQDIYFPVWSLREFQSSPDTIAEVVIFNPDLQKIQINVGQEAFEYRNKYKESSGIAFPKRVANIKDVRSESKDDECKIPPWESLES